MRFLIDATMGQMSIDNATFPISTSGLGANVQYVSFNKDDGEILYNPSAVVALNTSIYDPSPYQSYVNSWLTAAAASSPALTLAQAQQVKNTLTSIIYDAYLRLPLTYQLANNSSYNFDDSDSAVAYLALALGALLNTTFSDLSTTVTDINSNFTSLISGINANIVSRFPNAPINVSSVTSISIASLSTVSVIPLASTVTAVTSSSTSTSSAVLHFASPPMPVGARMTVADNTTPGAFTSGQTVQSVSGSTVTLSAHPNVTVSAGDSITFSLPNPTSLSLSAGDFFGLISAIGTNNESLIANRNSLQAAIAAAASIAAVIGIDITTGW